MITRPKWKFVKYCRALTDIPSKSFAFGNHISNTLPRTHRVSFQGVRYYFQRPKQTRQVWTRPQIRTKSRRKHVPSAAH